MKHRILAALAALPDLGSISWAAAFPIAASLSLNLAILQTSQGEEIIAAVRAGSIVTGIVTIVTLVYCAFACHAATLLATHSDPAASARALALGRLLGFWVFAWIVLSGHAAFVHPRFSAAVTLLVMVGTLLLLPVFTHSTGTPNVPKTAHSGRSGGSTFLVILGLGVFIAIAINPVLAGRALGPWALVNVAFGFWPLLATIVFVVWPRRMGLPALTLLPLLLLVLFRNINDNHELRVTQDLERHIETQTYPQTDPTEAAFRKGVHDWLVERCGDVKTTEIRPCPVFFVAAEGGGLRAAYWTALVLDHLDTSTHGKFYDHLFAISGVSGGSVGAGAYVSARVDSGGEPIAAKLDRYLSEDYLSPLLGSFLFTDFLQHFLPFPIRAFDRGLAFEQGLETSWTKEFGSTRFSDNFLDLWRDNAGHRAPALFLNATNVETGKRFIVSNVVLPAKWRNDSYFAFDPSSLYQIRSMPLSTATHVSARFPFVSPPGVLMSRASEQASYTGPARNASADRVVWGRLVDGGYFEVSGASTVNDLMNAFAAEVDDMHRGAELPPFIRPELIAIMVSNDPAPLQFATGTFEAPPPPIRPLEPPMDTMYRYLGHSDEAKRALKESSIWATSPRGSELLSPIAALFATRDARATREKTALAQRVRDISFGTQFDCIKTVLNVSETTGRETTEGLKLLVMKGLMAALTGDDERIARCTPLRGYEDFSLGRYLNAMQLDHEAVEALHDIKRSADISSPGLGWFLSARSRKTMQHAVATIDRDMYFANLERGNLAIVALNRYYKAETVDMQMSEVDKQLEEILAEPEPEAPTKTCEELTQGDNLDIVLDAAIVNSDPGLVECTLKKGANPNYTRLGDTILFFATFTVHYNPDIVRLLLEHGAKPDVPSGQHHITPLMEASQKSPEIVRLLIERGANVDAQTDYGTTPLMAAAQSCNTEAAKLLLAAHADPSRKDNEGRTAVVLTRPTILKAECTSVRDLLESAATPAP